VRSLFISVGQNDGWNGNSTAAARPAAAWFRRDALDRSRQEEKTCANGQAFRVSDSRERRFEIASKSIRWGARYLITLSSDAAPYTAFQHEGIEFIYMLSGEVVYALGDRSYHLSPGDALLFDSGAPHGPEKLLKTPMTYLSIIIYPRT
jgi:mannose-6-phosphate isomerase-like protein (cupin superfamily)